MRNLILPVLAGVALCTMAQGAVLVQPIALTTSAEPHAVDTSFPGGGNFNPSGFAVVSFDTDTKLLTWNIEWSGLTGPVWGVHFHGPAAEGDTAPILITLGSAGTPGSTPEPGVLEPVSGSTFIGDDPGEELWEQQLSDGLWYINVHTDQNLAGEIRGQVQAIPEPGTILLTGVGTAFLAFIFFRRR